jgi:hypothetical protein
MDTKVDIFEKVPDGTLVWRCVVPALLAVAKVNMLAGTTRNELLVIDSATKKPIAKVKPTRKLSRQRLD